MWIETDSTVTRAGLESLLEGSTGIDLVDSPVDADVVLRDVPPNGSEDPISLPAVMLSDQAMNLRLLRLGVYSTLPRDARVEQIAAALHAASARLIAIPQETGERLFPSAAAEWAVESLTPREMEALEMLAEGISNKQIAARLHISEHTAKFHVNSILNKLGAGTRTEAVMRGLRSGLLKV